MTHGHAYINNNRHYYYVTEGSSFMPLCLASLLLQASHLCLKKMHLIPECQEFFALATHPQLIIVHMSLYAILPIAPDLLLAIYLHTYVMERGYLPG